MKKGIFLSLITTCAFASDYQIHILKEGETISNLLHSQGKSPLYGKDQWVEKTLQMNHLKSVDAKEIKKGFPIILPKNLAQQAETKEQVDYAKAEFQRNSRTDLKNHYFNTVSDHQDIFFDLNYGQKSFQLPSGSVYLPETYGMSLKVQGKNNFFAKNFIYNFDGKIEVQSQGPGKFENNKETAITLVPTTILKSGVSIKHGSIPFEFGPTLQLEETSLVIEEDDATLGTRRDQNGLLGFQVKKSFRRAGMQHHVQANIQKNIFQSNFNGLDGYEKNQANISYKLNLTQNYMAGIFHSTTTYEQLSTLNDDITGINFSYLIK